MNMSCNAKCAFIRFWNNRSDCLFLPSWQCPFNYHGFPYCRPNPAQYWWVEHVDGKRTNGSIYSCTRKKVPAYLHRQQTENCTSTQEWNQSWKLKLDKSVTQIEPDFIILLWQSIAYLSLPKGRISSLDGAGWTQNPHWRKVNPIIWSS